MIQSEVTLDDLFIEVWNQTKNTILISESRILCSLFLFHVFRITSTEWNYRITFSIHGITPRTLDDGWRTMILGLKNAYHFVIQTIAGRKNLDDIMRCFRDSSLRFGCLDIVYHWWKLRRNGHNLFIIWAWLWTNLFLYLKTESRYRRL